MAFWRGELIALAAKLKGLEAGLPGTYQPINQNLTDIAALTTTAYGRAFLTYANEAAFKAAVNLEAGTDFLTPTAIASAYQVKTAPVDKAAGSYTAGVADYNQFWRATGAVAVNLTAAATLGSGWAIWVKADGGTVTIDPNGAETINGAATLSLAVGFSALVFCSGSAFQAIVFSNGDVTLAGIQTLTNKTINGGTISQPTLILLQGTNPTPTAEGDLQWDTDDNVIVVGDGVTQKVFPALPASTASGDMLYLSGAKVFARVAKGTAGQVWTMNAGATAPEWQTLTVDYGAGNAALAYGAVGTYVMGYAFTTGLTANSTLAGSSIKPAGAYSSGAASADDTVPVGTTVMVKGGSALSGTWRIMGQSNNSSGTSANRLTLFLRIA
ncbi:MAG: hypothetical protein LCH86_09595 [Proteobacteria bacterium]|nr:hypothetical protein [Pseudomonadota bacterium]